MDGTENGFDGHLDANVPTEFFLPPTTYPWIKEQSCRLALALLLHDVAVEPFLILHLSYSYSRSIYPIPVMSLPLFTV